MQRNKNNFFKLKNRIIIYYIFCNFQPYLQNFNAIKTNFNKNFILFFNRKSERSQLLSDVVICAVTICQKPFRSKIKMTVLINEFR